MRSAAAREQVSCTPEPADADPGTPGNGRLLGPFAAARGTVKQHFKGSKRRRFGFALSRVPSAGTWKWNSGTAGISGFDRRQVNLGERWQLGLRRQVMHLRERRQLVSWHWQLRHGQVRRELLFLLGRRLLVQPPRRAVHGIMAARESSNATSSAREDKTHRISMPYWTADM
jgi:hypothetical protein